MNTRLNRLSATLLASACALAFAAHPARADIIGSTTSANFTAAPYTVAIANAGSLTFSYIGGDFNPTADAVATSGSVAINSSGFPGPGQQPIPFELDSTTIGANGYTTFTSFPSATPIAYSLSDTTIGFDFTASDGTHYGYADITGGEFLGYGYETVAGNPIASGAAPTPVPEPSSIALLGTALGLLGFAFRRQKR